MNSIQKIIELLNQKGISGAKMSKDLGFSNAVFSQWKTGKQNPSIEKLTKIAKYLEVSTDYLLGTEQNKKSPSINDELNMKFNMLTDKEKAVILEKIDALLK